MEGFTAISCECSSCVKCIYFIGEELELYPAEGQLLMFVQSMVLSNSCNNVCNPVVAMQALVEVVC